MQVKSRTTVPHLGQDSVQPEALREGEKTNRLKENQDQEMWTPWLKKYIKKRGKVSDSCM